MRMLGLSFSVVLLDQATKHLVRSYLVLGRPREVIPFFFDLRYIQNTGAAWGMLAGLNNGLILLSAIMLVVIVVFRRYFIVEGRVSRLAIGLMVGGIIGNLVDRVKFGYVVDFLDFYWKSVHFPAFNVADSAICTGIGLYVIVQLFLSKGNPDERTEESSTSGLPARDSAGG